jgi:hypothetical protein
MNKIKEVLKHFWSDHKIVSGVIILIIVIATIL